MFAIKTENLTKYYLNGKVKALNGLNLEVIEGEIFGYIGPNGAGKSTTIKLMLDLIRPTKGSGQIFNFDFHTDSLEIKKNIGYLPGEIFLPELMSGKECLDYYKAFKEKVDNKYLKNLLSRFDLDLNKKIANYSKGNKQKLAIILALMHKPRLLILDEPTSGLDPLNQKEFYAAILETKEWNATTFFSTHILNEAESICDRVTILKEGELVKIENIDSFKEKNLHKIIVETTDTIDPSDLKTEGIKEAKHTAIGYEITTTGKNGRIIKMLSKYSITDYKINEPSLEEVFMHYYKS